MSAGAKGDHQAVHDLICSMSRLTVMHQLDLIWGSAASLWLLQGSALVEH